MTFDGFTPLSALLGGAMIGLSAVLLMGLMGRIAGISCIVARLFPPPPLAWVAATGALALGVGWGLVAFRSGPASVALGAGHPEALLFVPAMLAGMVLARRMALRGTAAEPAQA